MTHNEVESQLEAILKNDKDRINPPYVYEEDYTGGSSRYIREDIIFILLKNLGILK